MARWPRLLATGHAIACAAIAASLMYRLGVGVGVALVVWGRGFGRAAVRRARDARDARPGGAAACTQRPLGTVRISLLFASDRVQRSAAAQLSLRSRFSSGCWRAARIRVFASVAALATCRGRRQSTSGVQRGIAAPSRLAGWARSLCGALRSASACRLAAAALVTPEYASRRCLHLAPRRSLLAARSHGAARRSLHAARRLPRCPQLSVDSSWRGSPAWTERSTHRGSALHHVFAAQTLKFYRASLCDVAVCRAYAPPPVQRKRYAPGYRSILRAFLSDSCASCPPAWVEAGGHALRALSFGAFPLLRSARRSSAHGVQDL